MEGEGRRRRDGWMGISEGNGSGWKRVEENKTVRQKYKNNKMFKAKQSSYFSSQK